MSYLFFYNENKTIIMSLFWKKEHATDSIFRVQRYIIKKNPDFLEKENILIIIFQFWTSAKGEQNSYATRDFRWEKILQLNLIYQELRIPLKFRLQSDGFQETPSRAISTRQELLLTHMGPDQTRIRLKHWNSLSNLNRTTLIEAAWGKSVSNCLIQNWHCITTPDTKMT